MIYAEWIVKWRRYIVCEQAPWFESTCRSWQHSHSCSNSPWNTRKHNRGVYDGCHLKTWPCHCSLSLQEKSSSHGKLIDIYNIIFAHCWVSIRQNNVLRNWVDQYWAYTNFMFVQHNFVSFIQNSDLFASSVFKILVIYFVLLI